MDAWLLSLFPGRTLEELDDIDYPRLLRALEADQIQHVERERRRYLADKVSPKNQDARVQEAIKEHELLLQEHLEEIT